MKYYKNKKENKVSKYLKDLFSRSLLCLALFLFLAILCKTSSSYKQVIYKNLYEKNLSFTTIKNFYDNYLGGISLLDKYVNNTKEVFNENLVYNNASKYYDGVALEVSNNYLVPVIESGLVVYIGQKENYGNVVIIQGMDGIDISYSNINNTSVKLYDYIEKGDLLGQIEGSTLYLVYSKDGNILNYEEYLS